MKSLINIVSTFSNFKSLIKLNQLDEYIKINKFDALCLTDTNLRGFYKFYHVCIKNNIKPIIGLTVYLKNDLNKENEIILIAKNNKGLTDLFCISSQIKLEENGDFIKNDRIYSDIFCVIPSYNKYISDYLKKDHFTKVDYFIETLKNKFKKVYFGLELNNINLMNLFQEKIKLEFLPMLKTCYFKEEDYKIFGLLGKIEKKELINSEFYHKYYFKTDLEMEYLEQGIEYLSDNYEEFINQINITDIKKKLELPIFNKNIDSFGFLKQISLVGLKKRVSTLSDKESKPYLERLKYELKIIKDMNYEDYFLIVYDCVNFSKKNDILVGPGRGSSAGSLVCYCLGITNIDPIKYDLYFERFLNPERITMPDIDLDFPDDKREIVLKYLVEKYGTEHVASINTFVEFGVKSSIRDVSKALEIKSFKMEEVLKNINSYETIAQNLLKNHSLQKILVNNLDLENMLDMASVIQGLVRQTSTHAAGIILSKDNLYETIPLEKGSYNFLAQTQLEASDLEEIGLLKIDFLGITNLAIIYKIIKLVKNDFDINKIDMSDDKTFELLSNANTLGIFQLESDGIRNVLMKMKPNSLEDLSAVLALYRPGPMENIDSFISRKNGENYNYIHSDLENILKGTYGIIVYQEQILRILNEFAGLSLGEADVFRRYISKKNEEKLKELKKKFISNCLVKKYNIKIAEDLFAYILKFANYGFVKSHSISYALVSYQMSYLKANYPLEFFCVYLNYHYSGYKGADIIFNELKKYQVEVQIPTINVSQNDFIIENNKIIYGLKAINGLGNSSIKSILKNNNYQSFVDFVNRTSLNNKELEVLVKSGYFDIYEENRVILLKKIKANSLEFESFLSDIIFKKEDCDLETLKGYEYESLGINIKYDLFEVFYSDLKMERNYIKSFEMDSFTKALLQLVYVKVFKNKNDKMMAFLKFSDGREEIDGIIFDYDYSVHFELSKFYTVSFELKPNYKTKIKQLVIREMTKFEKSK